MSACVHCKIDLPAGTRVCPACRAPQPIESSPIAEGAKIELGYARLVVEARLGAGAMGVVWRGWLFYAPDGPRRSQPPSPIALKELKPIADLLPQMRHYFMNEAEALRQLAHPNVVGFYDLIEYAKSLAIVMELVDGDTLEAVIARHVARAKLAGPGSLPGMPFQRAWYYFQQLLGALAASHALGIVHRDVKPSNILIRRDGIVKLTDFGIARLTRDPDGRPRPKTAADFVPGTGAYMSPEQVLAQPIDGRSDLYSAATVLYEMLTGRTPFTIEEKSEFAVRLEQVEATPPPIRAFLPQAPPVLDALFARAFAKTPDERFPGAIEMGEAFRVALGLPDSAEWQAQAEMARQVEAESDAQRAGPGPRFKTARLATLRDFLVKGYRTVRMGGV